MILSNSKFEKWREDSIFENAITFFTPTYNRADFIGRVYDCLLKQTNKRFIWILVDDGSKDNTQDVARSLLSRNQLPMLFISKPNGGKHSAFEVALGETNTEYFMCMDDDDIYSNQAVETYLSEWARIKQENKYDIIGAIRTLAQEEDGTIVAGKAFDKSLLGSRIDQTTLVSNYIKHEFYENWTCYRTDALRSVNLFSKDYWMHEKHKFFNESIWQGRFARKYLCRYYFVVLREYRHDTEHSLTRSNKSRQHYMDLFINTKISMDEQLDYIQKSPIMLLKKIAIISILRIKLGISLKDLLQHTSSFLLKLCYIVSMPIAFLFKNLQIK